MFKKMNMARVVVVLIAVIALAGCSVAAQPRVDDGQEPESPEPTEPEMTTVTVYFVQDGDFIAVDREVPADEDLLRSAIEQLLAGPTSEEAEQGMYSWFSEETVGMLNSVELTDGVVIVDFENFSTVIPGASSSAGSQELIGPIQRTIFEFEEVNSIDLRFDGDSSLFWNWLQCESQLIEREQ